jgi:aryl-alcohol dehydrogenase-like predicted oxidoreductase
VIAYSPLAQGVLGGRYDAAHPPSGPTRLNNPLCLPENLERAGALIDTLRRVAAAHDATPAQVALAWLIRKPNVVAIPGASSVDQLRHNVEAADLDLTDAEAQELTAESDRFSPVNIAATVAGRLRARRAAA